MTYLGMAVCPDFTVTWGDFESTSAEMHKGGAERALLLGTDRQFWPYGEWPVRSVPGCPELEQFQIQFLKGGWIFEDRRSWNADPPHPWV